MCSPRTTSSSSHSVSESRTAQPYFDIGVALVVEAVSPGCPSARRSKCLLISSSHRFMQPGCRLSVSSGERHCLVSEQSR